MKFLFNWPQFIFSVQFYIIYAFTSLWKLKIKKWQYFYFKENFTTYILIEMYFWNDLVLSLLLSDK